MARAINAIIKDVAKGISLNEDDQNAYNAHLNATKKAVADNDDDATSTIAETRHYSFMGILTDLDEGVMVVNNGVTRERTIATFNNLDRNGEPIKIWIASSFLNKKDENGASVPRQRLLRGNVYSVKLKDTVTGDTYLDKKGNVAGSYGQTRTEVFDGQISAVSKEMAAPKIAKATLADKQALASANAKYIMGLPVEEQAIAMEFLKAAM